MKTQISVFRELRPSVSVFNEPAPSRFVVRFLGSHLLVAVQFVAM